MKTTKKIIAILVVIFLCFSLAACRPTFLGCRPANEIALTYTIPNPAGEDRVIEITTALYMAHMIEAEADFRTRALEEHEPEEGQDPGAIDHRELTVEDTSYNDWVRNRTRELIDRNVFYEVKFENLGLAELGEELLELLESEQLDGEWYQQGMREVYEPNGVSFRTFVRYRNAGFKGQLIWLFYTDPDTFDELLFGADEEVEDGEEYEDDEDDTLIFEDEDGEEIEIEFEDFEFPEEIQALLGSLRPEDSVINENLNENFVLVNAIHVSLMDVDEQGGTQPMSDEAQAAHLATLRGYLERLEGGEDFLSIFNAYVEDFELDLGEDADEIDPVSRFQQVLSSAAVNEQFAERDEADPNFEYASEMENGAVSIIENEESLVLIKRLNILEETDVDDNSYVELYAPRILEMLVREDFDEQIVNPGMEDFVVVENTSALNFYTPARVRFQNAG